MAPASKLAPNASLTLEASEVTADARALGPRELAAIVEALASQPDEWMGRVRLRVDRRWYERLHSGANHDVWLISWLPGQSTGFHDHGASSGAFVVAMGLLEEQRPGGSPQALPAGQSRAFGPDYTHDVRNGSSAPAISIHAYSPPLSEMNEYELEGDRLVPRDGGLQQAQKVGPPVKSNVKSIEQVLAAARAQLQRLSPHAAYQAAAAQGAVLVDIRPEAQRKLDGSIAGALVVERNVLEWRFDPASSAKLPIATDHDLQVIVFCSEGYTSSLAAAALQDLGLWRATDIVGGFEAWRSAGLPTGGAAQ